MAGRPIKGTPYRWHYSPTKPYRITHDVTVAPLGFAAPTGEEPGFDVYRPTGRKMLGHVRTLREAVDLLEQDAGTVAGE